MCTYPSTEKGELYYDYLLQIHVFKNIPCTFFLHEIFIISLLPKFSVWYSVNNFVLIFWELFLGMFCISEVIIDSRD